MEQLMLWLPAITSTGLLAAALWLGRELISTRLTKSVQHEFDIKIEEVRAELRTSEERFKAQLREKETEIAALRNGALSVLTSRQAALDKRRLEAVDQLWSAFNALTPARSITASMATFNFKTAAQRAENEPKLRQFFEMIGGDFNLKSLDLSEAVKARPFVSPMVWAVYSAIQAITMHGVMRWHVLKGGLGQNDFVDHSVIKKLIITALPELSEYIEKSDPSAYYYVLEALDTRLIDELQKMLSGAEIDKASVEKAAEIIQQVNALQTATKQSAIVD